MLRTRHDTAALPRHRASAVRDVVIDAAPRFVPFSERSCAGILLRHARLGRPMNNARPSTRPPRRRWQLLLAPILGCALLLATDARAAGTSPVLGLTAATASVAANGDRLVSAEGSFNFDDLVQIPFPAAGLMVVQGSRFVRYEVDGSMVEATSSSVADGVLPTDLPGLLAIAGSPVGPARLVRIHANGVDVVLPSDFTAGSALVLLYAHHQTEYFVSNAIPVVLP